MIMIRRQERRDGDAPTQFVPGELVRHRRYGYRGVVVALDTSCRAPAEWYDSNQTQPKKDQPWYHVLVDQSTSATYAAEENLEADRTAEPVMHPLIDVYFESFEAGFYVRNGRPWGSP